MKKFIWAYLAIAVVVAIYQDIWGLFAYKGFAYNLGRSLFWPVMIFPGLGKLIAGVVVLGIGLWATFSKRD